MGKIINKLKRKKPKTIRWEVRFPKKGQIHYECDISEGPEIKAINRILNRAESNEELSGALAELIEEYQSGESEFFPDYISEFPIKLQFHVSTLIKSLNDR